MRLISPRSMYLLALPALLVLSSCDNIRFWESDTGVRETVTTAQKQVLSVRNQASIIQSSIGDMQRRDLPAFRIGDSVLTVSLYSENGDIRLIDERIDGGIEGSARNRYYFDNSSLFHFYGKAQQRVDPGATEARFGDVRMRMYFNTAGNLFDYEYRINGSVADMSEEDLPRVLQRSVALRMLTDTDSSGAIDTTAFVDLLYHSDDTPLSDLHVSDASTTREEAAPEMTADAELRNGPPEEDAEELRSAAENRPAPAKQQPASAKQQPAPAKQQPAPAKQQPAPAKQAPPAEFAGPGVADAVIPVHTHALVPGTVKSHRVLFPKGSTSAALGAQVGKGTHQEYVLRARRGQRMSVTLQSENADIAFRVFLRDGDISGKRRSWNGTLPRYGDYHVLVYQRPDAAAKGTVPFTLTIGIE